MANNNAKYKYAIKPNGSTKNIAAQNLKLKSRQKKFKKN